MFTTADKGMTTVPASRSQTAMERSRKFVLLCNQGCFMIANITMEFPVVMITAMIRLKMKYVVFEVTIL